MEPTAAADRRKTFREFEKLNAGGKAGMGWGSAQPKRPGSGIQVPSWIGWVSGAGL